MHVSLQRLKTRFYFWNPVLEGEWEVCRGVIVLCVVYWWAVSFAWGSRPGIVSESVQRGLSQNRTGSLRRPTVCKTGRRLHRPPKEQSRRLIFKQTPLSLCTEVHVGCASGQMWRCVAMALKCGNEHPGGQDEATAWRGRGGGVKFSFLG